MQATTGWTFLSSSFFLPSPISRIWSLSSLEGYFLSYFRYFLFLMQQSHARQKHGSCVQRLRQFSPCAWDAFPINTSSRDSFCTLKAPPTRHTFICQKGVPHFKYQRCLPPEPSRRLTWPSWLPHIMFPALVLDMSLQEESSPVSQTYEWRCRKASGGIELTSLHLPPKSSI